MVWIYGGGFQAGVILSVAFIFYALVFGLGGGLLMSRNFLKRIDVISNTSKAIMAGGLLLLSLMLSRFGIIDLVAKGYSSLAWGFFTIFTVPTLTIGIWKIFK